MVGDDVLGDDVLGDDVLGDDVLVDDVLGDDVVEDNRTISRLQSTCRCLLQADTIRYLLAMCLMIRMPTV